MPFVHRHILSTALALILKVLIHCTYWCWFSNILLYDKGPLPDDSFLSLLE